MKVDIWMPLYIGDYLADTSRLTTEQHGAYLLLIMDYWRSGRPPDNDQVLAQICKLSPDAWRNAKAMLKQYFSIEDGCWVHKRIEAEILDAAQNQDRKHQRAVKGAAARWNKANNDASSNAQAMPMQCPLPSPSPSPINTTTKELATKVAQTKTSQLSKDWVLPDEWAIWAKEQRPDLNINQVADGFKDYWISEAKRKADWFATWRNWIRKQRVDKQSAVYEAPWQKANRLRVAELTPRIARKDPNEKYVTDMEFFSNLKEIGNGTSN